MPFSVRLHLVSTFIAFLVGSVDALAQGASVGAVIISARHPLLGDPLTGAALSVSVPQRDERLALRFGADRLHGRADRYGVACAGLIQSGTCPPEPLRDEARLTSASGGVVFRVLHWRHALMAITSDLTLASLQTETHGRTSGRTLAAAKMLWGGRLGGKAAWTPAVRVPFALEIEGGVGRFAPIVHGLTVDGYTPFERGFDVRILRLGLAWRP
jgi:hypothetical protein